VSPREVALHEAGHAVVARFYGGRIKHVTVEGSGPHMAWAESFGEWGGAADARCWMRVGVLVDVFLAGVAAAPCDHGDPLLIRHAWSAITDYQVARTLAQLLVASNPGLILDDDVGGFLQGRWEQMKLLVHEHGAAVEAVAGELLAHGTLTGERVARVIVDAMGGQLAGRPQ
jgi:hypothetical protein